MIIIQEIVLILQGEKYRCKIIYMYKSSAKVSKYLYRELLKDPLHHKPEDTFVYYDLLQLNYRRCKMTHVGLLSVGALPCNSHVNHVTQR